MLTNEENARKHVVRAGAQKNRANADSEASADRSRTQNIKLSLPII